MPILISWIVNYLLQKKKKNESPEKVVSENIETLDVVKESKNKFDTLCVHIIASLQNSTHTKVDDGTLDMILGIMNFIGN